MNTKLTIEFPMYVLATYNGGLSNLDETLDDNITYIIGRHFHENKIGFAIESMDTIPAVPSNNDELVRYVVNIESDDSNSCAQAVVRELTADRYAKGCTIRGIDGVVLYADSHTADIQLRREKHGNAT